MNIIFRSQPGHDGVLDSVIETTLGRRLQRMPRPEGHLCSRIRGGGRRGAVRVVSFRLGGHESPATTPDNRFSRRLPTFQKSLHPPYIPRAGPLASLIAGRCHNRDTVILFRSFEAFGEVRRTISKSAQARTKIQFVNL
jgi:hypothetical protein